ncbi:hypothetical protein [Arthrobacter sp. ISL-48]|uniref:hypothetical protein n=1 Tax=Arthrobacter sp. ISL-48 TaxID=2819110 RepID=UPI00288A54E1|nr:hypothetical protein [Arthrobacter sp. ISL-48]
MPAVTESIVLGAWTALFWGAILVCTVAVTVFAVRRHISLSGERGDTLFWDLFMGSAVAVPAILIPTLASPWAGVALAALGGATGFAAYRSHPRIMAWQSLRRQQRQDQPRNRAAAERHDALLERWRQYELDPASCIDYPAMTDVRLPETSALIRAMREAEQLRAARHLGYLPAVDRLDQALLAAEKAAGIPVRGI